MRRLSGNHTGHSPISVRCSNVRSRGEYRKIPRTPNHCCPAIHSPSADHELGTNRPSVGGPGAIDSGGPVAGSIPVIRTFGPLGALFKVRTLFRLYAIRFASGDHATIPPPRSVLLSCCSSLP